MVSTNSISSFFIKKSKFCLFYENLYFVKVDEPLIKIMSMSLHFCVVFIDGTFRGCGLARQDRCHVAVHDGLYPEAAEVCFCKTDYCNKATSRGGICRTVLAILVSFAIFLHKFVFL